MVQQSMLQVNIFVPQQPVLPLNVSVLQKNAFQGHIYVLHQPVLPLYISVLQQSLLPMDVSVSKAACSAFELVFPRAVYADRRVADP